MQYSFESSLGRLTQQVSKGLGHLLEEKFSRAGYDIGAAQWTVISYLKARGPSTQKEIGNFMKYNKVMIKRIVDKLQSKGYVRRIPDDDDRRYNIVELTVSGKNLYVKLSSFAASTLEEVYKDIKHEELETCLYTLGKVARKIEKFE
ncbi:MAG: MarR family winged helix-turn-helix transcriptional regulator [Bacteroidales bacterium]